MKYMNCFIYFTFLDPSWRLLLANHKVQGKTEFYFNHDYIVSIAFYSKYLVSFSD